MAGPQRAGEKPGCRDPVPAVRHAHPGDRYRLGPDAPGVTTSVPAPEPGKSGETKTAPAETEVVDEYFQN